MAMCMLMDCTLRFLILSSLLDLCLPVTASSLRETFPTECGGIATSAWTSPHHVAPGYHVLCISQAASTDGVCMNKDSEECKGAEEGALPIVACWGGLRSDCESFRMPSPQSFLDLELNLTARNSLRNPSRYGRIKKAKSKKQTWKGLFKFYKVHANTEAPVRIISAEEVTGLILVFEGGAFVWPGVEVGFRRNITLRPHGRYDTPLDVELYTKSLKPLILQVSSFLDKPECSHVIKKAEPHIKKSVVSHMDHDVGKPSTDWRSSSTYFMPSDDDTMTKLDRRVAALTVTEVAQQEYAQVLRYEVGERYAAHTDYFDPDMYQKSEEIQSLTKRGLFNRLMTVFFYLSTVEQGGHTNFPRAGGLSQPMNFEACDTGISISPQEGRIIIFYSQNPAGQLDELSLHGGCAVKKGLKWSLNKWIWNKNMNYLKG